MKLLPFQPRNSRPGGGETAGVSLARISRGRRDCGSPRPAARRPRLGNAERRRASCRGPLSRTAEEGRLRSLARFSPSGWASSRGCPDCRTGGRRSPFIALLPPRLPPPGAARSKFHRGGFWEGPGQGRGLRPSVPPLPCLPCGRFCKGWEIRPLAPHQRWAPDRGCGSASLAEPLPEQPARSLALALGWARWGLAPCHFLLLAGWGTWSPTWKPREMSPQ